LGQTLTKERCRQRAEQDVCISGVTPLPVSKDFPRLIYRISALKQVLAIPDPVKHFCPDRNVKMTKN